MVSFTMAGSWHWWGVGSEWVMGQESRFFTWASPQGPLIVATWVFSQTGLCIPGMSILSTGGEDAHPRGPSLKHQVCGHPLSSFSCIYFWLAGSWLLHACLFLLQ